MQQPIIRIASLCLIMPLAGCLSVGGSKQQSAMQVDAKAITELGGGLIGEASKLSLSDDAEEQALDAEYRALQFAPAGIPVRWQADGFQGEVVPTQLYRVGSQDCRGYSHSVVHGKKTAKVVGTACRTQDGNWKPVA